MKKESIFSLVAFSILFLAITAGCKETADKAQKALVTTMLAQTVKDLNKDCPKMIDKDVRIDKVLTPSDSVLQYNYTLTNVAIADLDTSVFISAVKPGLVQMMQTDSDFKVFADYNVTVAFQYSDKNGVKITNVSVPPGIYKK